MTALCDEPVLTPTPASLYEEAEEFLRSFHEARPKAGRLATRLAKVRKEITATGTYRHKPAELAYGARLALRDTGWCPANVPWRGLLVRDLRRVRNSAEIAAQCVHHLRMATNDGAVCPMVSVFAPDTPWRPGPRIRNDQLVRYAGYAERDAVLGDGRYVEFTTAVCGLGWRPPAERTAFDRLPLVVRTEHEGVVVCPLPEDAVREVPLEHPDLPWFAALGLRWHAVPVISDRGLRIGGITYPAAPYNGVYICQAIGEDVLADDAAYGLARVVADRLGLDTTTGRTLWFERAVVELNRAVVHSYDTAGVTINHAPGDFLPARAAGGGPSFVTWEDPLR